MQSHLWYIVSCMRRSSCFEVAGGQVGPLSFASTYLAAYCKQAAENNRRRSCRLCSLSRPNVELRLCVDRNLVSSSCFPGSGLLRCCAGTPAEIWSLWQNPVALYMLLLCSVQGFGELEQRTSSQKGIYPGKLVPPRYLHGLDASGIWTQILCCRVCPSIHA